MDIEQMKMEALSRQLRGAIQKVAACQTIVGSMVEAANNPDIPVDIETLKKANADKYAETVDTAQKAVAELETSWPA